MYRALSLSFQKILIILYLLKNKGASVVGSPKCDFRLSKDYTTAYLCKLTAMLKQPNLYIAAALALILGTGCINNNVPGSTKNPDTPATRKERMLKALEEEADIQEIHQYLVENMAKHRPNLDKASIENAVKKYEEESINKIAAENAKLQFMSTSRASHLARCKPISGEISMIRNWPTLSEEEKQRQINILKGRQELELQGYSLQEDLWRALVSVNNRENSSQ